MANQYVNKVEYGSDTLIDLTSDTVTASTLLSGYTAHDRSGAPIVGVAVSGGYTVNFSTTNPDLYGATITIKQGSTVIGTVAFDNTGSASYTLSNPGTYTWSVTLAGETYTDTFVVVAPEVYIETTFVYRDWLVAGGLNPSDYAELAAVLADEDAVRQLMTIHAAVDYLASFKATDASVVTILNDNYSAKWISLTDYAMDVLEAAYGTLMGTIGKYGYGEWGITDATTTPPTWGALGNVPVMTSNTAPYGTASAYQVFDGNPSTTASGTDFSYTFTNPVCVKDFVVKDASGNAITGGTLQACNDGSTWGTPTDGEYYLGYRVHFASSVTVGTVQFYGRTLKVSVPKMSGNTTPYGEAICSTAFASTYAAYMVFDNVASAFTTSRWMPTAADNDAYVGYKFIGKKCITRLCIQIYKSGYSSSSFRVQIDGRNTGGSWTPVSDVITLSGLPSSNTYKWYDMAFANTTDYDDYRIHFIDKIVNSDTNFLMITEAQFYGKDYSEREWDTTHPRRYLYDHGVECEEIEKVLASNGWTMSGYTFDDTAVKEPARLKISPSSASHGNGFGLKTAIDTTSYTGLHVVDDAYNANDSYMTLYCAPSSKNLRSQVGYTYLLSGENSHYLDLTSINTNVCFAVVSLASASVYDYLYEMWLE